MLINIISALLPYFHKILQLSVYLLSKFFVLTIVSSIVFSFNCFAQIDSESSQKSVVANNQEKIIKQIRPRVVESKNNLEIAVQQSEVKNKNLIDIERNVFDLLNLERKAKGLSFLIWSEDLAKVARLHSENMAKYKFFSHVGLDGTLVKDRATSLGMRNINAIGENISYNRGYANPIQIAVDGWMNSESHRTNIMQKFWQESAIGVAMANDGTYYFTEVFISK